MRNEHRQPAIYQSRSRSRINRWPWSWRVRHACAVGGNDLGYELFLFSHLASRIVTLTPPSDNVSPYYLKIQLPLVIVGNHPAQPSSQVNPIGFPFQFSSACTFDVVIVAAAAIKDLLQYIILFLN